MGKLSDKKIPIMMLFVIAGLMVFFSLIRDTDIYSHTYHRGSREITESKSTEVVYLLDNRLLYKETMFGLVLGLFLAFSLLLFSSDNAITTFFSFKFLTKRKLDIKKENQQLSNQERWAKIPKSEKAKMMFQINKKKSQETEANKSS